MASSWTDTSVATRRTLPPSARTISLGSSVTACSPAPPSGRWLKKRPQAASANEAGLQPCSPLATATPAAGSMVRTSSTQQLPVGDVQRTCECEQGPHPVLSRVPLEGHLGCDPGRGGRLLEHVTSAEASRKARPKRAVHWTSGSRHAADVAGQRTPRVTGVDVQPARRSHRRPLTAAGAALDRQAPGRGLSCRRSRRRQRRRRAPRPPRAMPP